MLRGRWDTAADRRSLRIRRGQCLAKLREATTVQRDDVRLAKAAERETDSPAHMNDELERRDRRARPRSHLGNATSSTACRQGEVAQFCTRRRSDHASGYSNRSARSSQYWRCELTPDRKFPTNKSPRSITDESSCDWSPAGRVVTSGTANASPKTNEGAAIRVPLMSKNNAAQVTSAAAVEREVDPRVADGSESKGDQAKERDFENPMLGQHACVFRV